MTKNVYFAIDYYDRKVIQLIIKNYNMPPMEAMKSFIMSKTHAMLEDSKCGMLSLPEYAVYDMWETEKLTGDPRNSIYVKGE